MLKKILIGLAVAVLALVGFISTRPNTFAVQRSATIQAPPELAFALVNDFHRWGEWSPWDKLDPAMKRTFEGASAGVDAVYTWTGNDQVGEGRMKIEQSKANEQIRIELQFIRPFPSTNSTTFTFKPEGGGTSVTWLMEGRHNFMSKAFSAFMDMDAMVGKDFEKGLANMKTAAEAEAKKRAEEKAQAEKAAAAAAAAAAAPAEGQPAAGTAAAPTP
jgi:polyketide cyclase/dehydrase/lipid transport protein